MNKRGDLPVTLLIIGVFAVCTLALLSFFYSSFLLHKSFVGVDMVENANIQIETQNLEHFYTYKNATKFSPGLSAEEGIHLFKEKIIFSVEYNP
jgi:hypothetical protein